MNTTKHYSLNSNQLHYLKLIYKFRFVTTTLLSQHKHKDQTTTTYLGLKLLTQQGYIGRHYDKSYKLLGKPASYYLLPKGLTALKVNSVGTAKVYKNIYKDKTASDHFIAHCLSLFEIHNGLRQLYPDRLSYFSKSELAPAAYDYLPSRRPDAYLKLYSPTAKPKQFFLEYFESSSPLVSHIGRLRQYLNYFDVQQWSSKNPPTLLIVCQTTAIEHYIQKRLIKMKSPGSVYTATKSGLKLSPTSEVWRSTEEPDIRLALSDLP